MSNWTLKDLNNSGYDTNDVEITNSIGYWIQQKFASSRDIDIKDIVSVRLETNKWITCHKNNPKKGYIEQPVLNF